MSGSTNSFAYRTAKGDVITGTLDQADDPSRHVRFILSKVLPVLQRREGTAMIWLVAGVGMVVVGAVAALVGMYLATDGDHEVPSTVHDDPSLPKVVIDGYAYRAEAYGDPSRACSWCSTAGRARTTAPSSLCPLWPTRTVSCSSINAAQGSLVVLRPTS